MPIAEVNGQRIYHELHGEGEPLVLVTGLSADHLAWTLQTPVFAERFRTVVFDNRDVGQSSSADGPYEVVDMAADTLALADALELDSFHLLGMSMGGAIAQELALSAPERVRTLTLAVSFAGGGALARDKARLWESEVTSTPREEFLDRMLLVNFSEAFYETPGAIDYVRQMMLANPDPQAPEGFARQASATARHDTRARLGELVMPVHLIAGEHDVLLPVWKTHEMAEQIPHATVTVIPRAPHAVNLERAQEFNTAVLQFLDAHAPAPAG